MSKKNHVLLSVLGLCAAPLFCQASPLDSSSAETPTRSTEATLTLEAPNPEIPTIQEVADNNEGEASGQSDAKDAIQAPIQCEPKGGAVIFDFKKQVVHLEGPGLIKYDTLQLTAEDIMLYWAQRIVTATSKKNEQGEIEQKAVLRLGKEEYIAETIRYHLDSQGATATAFFTKQDDGLLWSQKIRKEGEKTFYGGQTTYTTCNLAKPHFHAQTNQFKFIQGDQLVSGPFRLYFDGVPTPLGLPFGLFFFPQKSGVIFPTYAGESQKGFGLTEGGYYFHFNDYADLTLQGEVYSKLTTRFRAQLRYKKRYGYDGELEYELNTDRHVAQQQTTRRLKYQHMTDTNRAGRLSIDIDLQSDSFKEDEEDFNQPKTQNTSSTLRYTNSLPGYPYRLSAEMRYYRYIDARKTKHENVALPDINLYTRNIYPLRRKGVANSHWYSDIYLKHTATFKNNLSNEANTALSFFTPQDWDSLFEKGQYGIQHHIPVVTNLHFLNYVTFTPEFNYQECWYGKRLDYSSNAAEEEYGSPFHRVYSYNLGGSFSSTLYGTHLFPPQARIQAIRHEMQPEVVFTYTPDFSEPQYGYFQTMPDGTKRERFPKAIYNTPHNRSSVLLKAGLRNKLQVKVRDRMGGKDETQKISILKKFDWSTGYDFQAEELPLQDIKVDLGTDILNDLLSIRLDASFDPYLHLANGQRHDEWAWKHGQGLGHVRTASLNMGMQLGPQGKKNFFTSLERVKKKQPEYLSKNNVAEIEAHPEKYVDFSIPWRLHMHYKWDYRAWDVGRQALKDSKRDKSLTFDGELNLTENWKVTLGTLYDLRKGKIVDNSTKITAYRDLHCWEMNFSCRPFGDKQTYEFSIGAKSPLLKALKYSRRRGVSSFW